MAIESKDLESVLFLIGVGVNVNFRVQDSSHRTPLHVAVVVGDEMILRNLVGYLRTDYLFMLKNI